MSVLDDEVWPLLRRANEHAESLKAAIAEWRNQNPNPMRAETDDEWRRVVLRYSFEPPNPFIGWGCIFGDLMHNLRSALDHLVWQLVLNEGGQPGRGNEFPIFDRPDVFTQEAKRDLRGISDWRVCALVEAFQPFRPLPAGYAAPPDPHRHPLWLVHEFDRLHKHQVVQVPLELAEGTHGDIQIVTSAPDEPRVVLHGGPAIHDAVFAEIFASGPIDRVDVDLHHATQVCVELQPGSPIEVSNVVKGCGFFVSALVMEFDDRFFT